VSLPPVIGNSGEQSRGFRIIDSPTALTITSSEPEAAVYYTIDGSDPTVQSNLYSEAINLNSSCDVRAISQVKGKVISSTTLFSIRKAKYKIDIHSKISPKYNIAGPTLLVDENMDQHASLMATGLDLKEMILKQLLTRNR
jgi:hypothetical protein